MQPKWTALSVTTVGVLMSGLDSGILIVGIPSVASALRADAEQAIWFTQAYMLGSTVALLFVGRVSDMFGKVRIYVVGFAVFVVGSVLTALSTNPNAFIVSRVIQGMGESAIFANSAAIITDSFPATQLGTGLGINQIAFRAGAMAGLTLSGVILAFADWPFLFYVNVPIGVFGIWWALRRLKDTKSPERDVPIDWKGVGVFTLFITSLLLALTYAGYGMGEIRFVVGLLTLSFLSLGVFIFMELRRKNPLLDLGLLRIREYTGGITTQLLNAMAWGGFLLVTSLYLQLARGYTPLAAGVAILPFNLSFLAAGPLSGRLSDRYGTRPFTTAGLAVMSLALFLSTTFDLSTPYTIVALCLVAGGIGLGMFSSPNISSIMSSVPAGRRSVASALRATSLNVGYALSLNIVILVMTLSLPFSEVTSIISSLSANALTVSEKSLFSNAIDQACLLLAVVNTIAIVPNLLRGSRKTTQLR